MDLQPLRGLLTVDGPFAFVYFDASHNTEDAAEVLGLRWRGLREDLRAQGADESTLEAMDPAVFQAEPAVAEPNQVSVREQELRGLGMPSITQQRADEALPLAALAVGAEIMVTDEHLADGVGVLLRRA